METLRYIFEIRALETGIFIVVLCKLIIIIQLITLNKSDEKSSKRITFKTFFKDRLFLILMLIYGLLLIFRSTV